jgi:surface antigen
MRGRGASTKSLFLLSVFTVGCQIAASPASAEPTRNHQSVEYPYYAARAAMLRKASHGRPVAHGRYYTGGGISCVPFARNASGISVGGNAWQWWDNAAGVYARGSIPEPGGVLAFQANGRMRLGHVAVVTRVINPREIEVEHANWWSGGMYGGVARNIPVVAISPANDWTAVRVGIGGAGQFGSVYPTYGFIYDRADTGQMLTARAAPAPQQDLNPPPSDLRPGAERGWQTYEEVAEAPAVQKRHIRVAHMTTSRHIHQAAVVDRRQ